MVFSWGCLTNVGPWKLKGSHGESLAWGCCTDVAMAGITIPALLNNLSRETLRSDRDTQGICQGWFCFHLLESGNDLNSQWSHPLRTPPTHLVLTLHLGSSVDCPASRLFRDRQIVSCWMAGSAMSPPCSVPAWRCWAEVCFNATLHRHCQSLLPSPPPTSSLCLLDSRNHKLFILLSPVSPKDFRLQNEWMPGPSNEAVQEVCQRWRSLLQKVLPLPSPRGGAFWVTVDFWMPRMKIKMEH